MSREPLLGGFLLGFVCGAVAGFAVMLAPIIWLGTDGVLTLYGTAVPTLHSFWQATSLNLQGSVLPFVIILAIYWAQLNKLRLLLAGENPVLEQVVRREQLLDLCANLFIGVGVIWTAIGMRNALLNALGDTGATASLGAFAVLERLVDGGILLALSTTIIGGIGGYLMRGIKAFAFGQELNAIYICASQQPAEQSLATLERIESLLKSGADEPPVQELR